MITASHFQEVTNGYERQTSGLWLHRGRLILQGPVTLRGDFVQESGNFTVNNGTIGTAEIAPDAVTALIGAQIATAGWTTTTTGVWVPITPLDKPATGTGARLRIDFTAIIQHSVASAVGLLALGWDNVAQIAVAYFCLPVANQPFTFSGTYYATSNVGVRTYQVFAYLYTAGTLALSGGAYSRLYMVEERR